MSLKVAGAASLSVDFVLHSMLGYTELNVDTTKNHPALTSYFTNTTFKNAVLLEIPLSSWKSDNVSIITSVCYDVQASYIRSP